MLILSGKNTWKTKKRKRAGVGCPARYENKVSEFNMYLSKYLSLCLDCECVWSPVMTTLWYFQIMCNCTHWRGLKREEQEIIYGLLGSFWEIIRERDGHKSHSSWGWSGCWTILSPSLHRYHLISSFSPRDNCPFSGGKNVMLDCGMHMGYSDDRS